MKRSVYSLVLANEVIEEVDKLAYSMNTSRSNLINQILAERVELHTPEMRMKDIFTQLEELMSQNFQQLSLPTDNIWAVKSPLRYKYRPTIKYSFELFRSFHGCVGKLKVSFRTQSKGFIDIVDSFFNCWVAIEEKYIGKYFKSGIPQKISDGRFERDFYEIKSGTLTDKKISVWVSQYIKLIDTCIQIYFDNLEDTNKAIKTIEKLYNDNLKDGTPIL
ncbi:MAG: hypothetical protein GX896_07525 [Clostridiales bacterium]|nr:hypothetical protein [Clostridiales bacterium]